MHSKNKGTDQLCSYCEADLCFFSHTQKAGSDKRTFLSFYFQIKILMAADKEVEMEDVLKALVHIEDVYKHFKHIFHSVGTPVNKDHDQLYNPPLVIPLDDED